MTVENSVLEGKEHALEIYLLGSKQRDVFVLHNNRTQASLAGVFYSNLRNIKGATWYGDNELELLGSGNKLSKVEGTAMKDDSARPRTGFEICNEPDDSAPQPK